MIVFQEHLEEIKQICEELSIRRLDLVGSAARGDYQPDRSDIDFLVEFKGKKNLFKRYFDLKEKLEIRLGKQVDLIQIQAVKNPYIKRTLENDRLTIYDA